MWKFFLLFSVLFANKSATLHPVYVSVTEIEYKPQQQRLEIGLKIFSDDLSDALSREASQMVEIGTDREHPQATDWLQRYVKKHFLLQANGKNLDYQYVGRELVREDFFAIWAYFEVRNVPNLQTLTVKNTILQQLFASQNNVINFRCNGKTKRASLYAHKPSYIFELE